MEKKRREVIGVLAAATVAGCLGPMGADTTTTPETGGDTTPGSESGEETPTGDGDWPMYRADPGNTGRTRAVGPGRSPDTLWSYVTEDVVHAPPAIVGRTAYVTDDDGVVSAIDVADGADRWRFETESGYRIRGSPAVHDDTVFAANTTLYALDAGDGTKRWERDLVSPAWSPIVTDGLVHVATNSQGVSTFDAESGDRLWEFTPGDGSTAIHAPLAVRGDTAMVVAGDSLHALDAATGDDRWSTSVGDGSVANVAPVATGDAVAVAVGSNLLSVDATTGDTRWRTSFDAPLAGPPAVSNDGLLVATTDGPLSMLDAQSGDRTGRVSIGGASASPAVSGTTAYLVNTDGVVHAVDVDRLDASTSTVLARDLPVGATTAPVVDGGVLYVAGRGLTALR